MNDMLLTVSGDTNRMQIMNRIKYRKKLLRYDVQFLVPILAQIISLGPGAFDSSQ